MHQKIEIKPTRKITYVRFFSNFGDQPVDGAGEFSFLITDLVGTPLRIASAEEEALLVRNQRNNFVFDSSVKIVTGFTNDQKLSAELTQEQKDNIELRFKSSQTEEFGKKSVNAVFFETRNDVDYFATVGIVRDYEILNTLSIYNNLVGETPRLESPTGVLFGKLEALQKVKDENGEKVRIPLGNVPVAIFNTSEEFPTVSSVDDDGNRIRLNLAENSPKTLYFNDDSFRTDEEFLPDNFSINSIPERYKYTAITNEKGEFVIFDVPVGERVFMMEIDLLKQGLTKDEVSLNFFGYPVEESPNVDNVPSFFFRQFSINIVPSWGDFQSGYTELNVTVPLDLRKWATYYASPISYFGVSLQERQNKGFFAPLNFTARDMAREGFPIRRTEVVEISDLLNKDFEQQLMWNEELKQTKSKAEFRKNDYQAFKLPANLYDPNGVGTNGKKGVWLCAYEILMNYFDRDKVYRSTGFQRDYATTGAVERSHFFLNRHTRSIDPTTLSTTLSATTGVFPYERPWSINYPSKYSIPNIPSILNPNKTYSSPGGIATTPKEPKWIDGDRVGDPIFDSPASGYGFQIIEGKLKPNIFSQRVTAGVIFKYEGAVSWEEQYSNGYQPVLDPSAVSSVKGGEIYQRLEAGYGYWLKPEGWPRILNNNWGDYILPGDYDANFTNPGGLSPSTYRGAVTKLAGEIITIKLDTDSTVKKGALDIYRVAEPNFLVEPGPPLLDKFARIEFQAIYVQNNNTPNRRLELFIDTNNDRLRYASGEGTMAIRNNGGIATTVLGTKIQPGETANFANKITSGLSILFPGNSGYDPNENSYNRADYSVTMTINIPGPSRDVTQSINISVVTDKSTSINYVTSRVNNTQTKSKVRNNGDIECSTTLLHGHDVLVDGMVFTASNSSVGGISVGSAITPSCTNNIPHTIL
jgi:hypothetical protein